MTYRRFAIAAALVLAVGCTETKTTESAPTLTQAALTTVSATWSSPLGVYQGPADAIVVHPAVANTVYLCSGSLVYKSTDGGATWTEKSRGLRALYYSSLALAPSDPEVLYAFSYYEGQVFRTGDGGESWALAGGPGGIGGQAIAVHPFNPDVVFVGNDSGLFRSTNAGVTFTSLGGVPGAVQTISVDPISPTAVYAGTRSGVYKSTDGGDSWASASAGLTSDLPYILIRGMAIDPANPSTLLVGVQGGGSGGGVFRSQDAGATWTQTLMFPWDLRIAVSPASPATVYASGAAGALFRSSDGGTTWTSTPIQHGVGGTISLGPSPVDPDTLFVTGINCCDLSPGVVKTVDRGQNWTVANRGIRGVARATVDPVHSDVIYDTKGWAGAYKSSDGGLTWQRIDKDSAGNRIYAHWSTIYAPPVADTARLYAGTSAGFAKSDDRGQSWRLSNAGLTSFDVQALAVDPSDPDHLVIATNVGLFRSADAGETWVPAATVSAVSSLTVDPASGNVIYAATYGYGVRKSTDGGDTFTPPGGGHWQGPLVMVPGSPRVYAGAGPALYKSDDGGASWQALFPPSGQPTALVTDVLFDPTNPLTMYVTDLDAGLFRSQDGGGTWSSVPAPFSTYRRLGRLGALPGHPGQLFVSGGGGFRVSFGPPPDTTAPVLTVPAIISATASSATGATVTFSVIATDDRDASPAVSCIPSSGSAFAPGTTTVDCSARDAAGNTTSGSFPVSVVFEATTPFFQPPIRPDGSSIFRLGRTVPVKFVLAGASGAISDLAARIYVAKISDSAVGSELAPESTASANTGNLIRYSSDGSYLFNLGTTQLSTGTWQIRVDLGDGVPHQVMVSLRP